MRRYFATLILSFAFLLSFGQQQTFELAQSYQAEGNHTEAISSYKKAGLDFQLNDQTQEYAQCNILIADCYVAMGRLQEANVQIKNTLDYIQEVLPQEKTVLIDGLLIQGEVFLKLGRNDLCIEALHQAESIIGAGMTMQAATCYNDLGVAYWNNQNKELALGYHLRAMQIRSQLMEPNSVALADSYLNLGLVYLEDDFLQAIIQFNKALEIYKQNFGNQHPQVALCYNNLAFANSNAGNYATALNYLDLTMSIWDATYDGDHPNKAFTLSNKGRIYEQQGDYDQALILQQEALQQYLRIYGPKHPEVANTYFLIGSVQQHQEEFDQALESFQKSIYANLIDQSYSDIYELPELSNYFSADILLSSMQSKAQALEARHFEQSLSPKDLKNSLATYEKCVSLISIIRQTRLNEADKLRIGKIANQVYDNGIRIALYLAEKTFNGKQYKAKAFEFCERSKAAVLLEAINETNAKSFAGIPQHLTDQEDSLKNEIAFFEQQLASVKSDEEMTRFRALLFDTKSSYRALVDQLETEYPEYFKLKYDQKIVTPEQIAQSLPMYNAMLSYFLGENAVYVFYITNDDFEAFTIPKSIDLRKMASGMRNGLKYRVDKGFSMSANDLYAQLIPEINRNVFSLVIIPDGILGTLPFESLKNKETGKYLIEDYSISYDYSATLLINKLNRKASEKQVSGILLAAPIDFSENEMTMPKLPGSEKEVMEIRYLFLSEEDAPTVNTKSKATETFCKSDELSQYRYLHFATHGIVNESKPELSRIFLTPDASEDGSLYSGEIFGLDINAELVTLSACETGLGKVEKGEGIIGLSRSLTYAGAENLIVSLWQVADESTAQLMIEFYRQHLHHSGRAGYADDLRKAKLSMINSELYNDPYYWAPFILIGK